MRIRPGLFLCLFLTLKANTAFGLINAKPLSGTSAVVRLTFTNGWVCSGVFLNASTILTAAHCLTPEPGKELTLKSILTENDEPLPFEQIALRPHPRYADQWWPAYDVGVIKVRQSSNVQTQFELETNEGKISDQAELYGCGRADLAKGHYQRTTGENRFVTIGSVLFFAGLLTSSSDRAGTAVSVAPNDSGGPIIDKASKKIIGVMTTTTLKLSNDYGLPILSTGTSTVTPENLSFIQSNLVPQ
jgi:hypothetical protein